MINKLLTIALIVMLAALFMPTEAWLDSTVLLETMGYRISTNWLVVAAALLTLILAWRFLVFVPRRVSFYYHKICTTDRADTLQNLMLAIYNYQAKPAAKLLAKLNDDPSPIIKMLKIKVMQLQLTKPEKLSEELDILLLDSNSKIFALEGLIETYNSQGNWLLVDKYSSQLWALHPSSWLLTIRMFAMFQLGAWEEAISFAKSGSKQGFLDKGALEQLQAIVRYKMAYALQEVDTARAIQSLEQAMDMHSIHPYALMVLLQIKSGHINTCISYAKKAWKYSPDICITKQIMLLTQRLSPKEFYNTCRDITSSHKDHYESLILMAEAYILLDDLIQANALLHKALALQNDQRVYMLLARCCQLMHGNVTEIYDWLNKACNATPLPAAATLYWDFTKMQYSSTPSEKSVSICIH